MYFFNLLRVHRALVEINQEQIMNEESVTPSNISDNESFENVLNAYMSRRALVVGGLAGAALTFFGGAAASAKSNGTVSLSALA